jgi:hypothetical protein
LPCRCAVTRRHTLNPVAEIMPDRCTPEYECVIAKMGSLLPYRRARTLLSDFLPVGDVPAVETSRRRRGSEFAIWGLHERAETAGLWARLWLRSWLVREAVSLPRSSALRLNGSEAQQRQPMRMALAGHQFSWAFAGALGNPAAHEAAMVQEEL